MMLASTVNDLLQRSLSPELYRGVRTCVWYGRFYLPRSVTGRFARRTPRVHGSSDLARRVAEVNVNAPTGMCRVMTAHGSDKGRGWHNYTTVYSALFGPLRSREVRIFELGLASANPKYGANMGILASPGGSLRGWRELFPKGQIFGADIDRDILFTGDRIRTFYCDQLDAGAIREMWAQVGDADIVIDDGLHTFEGNTSFLNGSLERVRRGGYYVVEDIRQTLVAQWLDALARNYSPRFPNFEFAFAELPNSSNDYDNNLLIAHRVR